MFVGFIYLFDCSYVILGSCTNQFQPDCPYCGGYSRPTTRLVRNLLLLTMTFLRKGLEWYENGKLLGFPGFDDPETIENQCAGQWVVCLTCHHSISVLGRPETRYWEEVYTPLYLVEGPVQHMHGDWGFSIRLAIQAGSCMIPTSFVYFEFLINLRFSIK